MTLMFDEDVGDPFGIAFSARPVGIRPCFEFEDPSRLLDAASVSEDVDQENGDEPDRDTQKCKECPDHGVAPVLLWIHFRASEWARRRVAPNHSSDS